MSLTLWLILALGVILGVLRAHQPIGVAMIAGATVIFLGTGADPSLLTKTLETTATSSRTWTLLFALYFVMCLEYELRVSGTLSRMLAALGRIASPRVTLALMPAFLGLLPSIGGARFSAPIVKATAEPLGVEASSAAAINFWFRHVFEFASPIIPGMILGCAIAGVGVGDLVLHLFWLSILAIALGWWVMIRPIKPGAAHVATTPAEGTNADILLAVLPVAVSVVLMLAWGLSAAVAMGLVVAGLWGVLLAIGRPVKAWEVIKAGVDKKLMLNILAIFVFINLLEASGALGQLVDTLKASALPFPVVIALIAFTVGVLTGMSQGHVAMVMPIVAAAAPGNLDLVGLAMVFGVAGQMVTPTHVCLTISVDYFKAPFFSVLKPVLLAEAALLLIYVAVFAWG